MTGSFITPATPQAESTYIFFKLPAGYSYDLVELTLNPKSGYPTYSVNITSPDGISATLLEPDETPICFKEEPDMFYEAGDVRNTLVRERLADDLAYHYHLYQYDFRTGAYFAGYQDAIGLLSSDVDDTLTIDDSWNLLGKCWFGDNNIFWKLDDDSYVTAFHLQAGFRAIFEARYTFNQMPTVENVFNAWLIDEIKLDFALNKIGESYVCWECGIPVKHWLDVAGSLEEKINKLRDTYCGC